MSQTVSVTPAGSVGAGETARGAILRGPDARMRILHVPFTFHPDPVGGTEVYVEALAHQLRALGLDPSIAAPTEGPPSTYDHAGLTVHRFTVGSADTDVRNVYGVHCDVAAEEFARLLARLRPDVVHFHAFTRGVNTRMAADARRFGAATVFTYHTPTVTCQRGTLLEFGSRGCDGVLDVRRCAACAMHGAGLGVTPSRALALLPAVVGATVARTGLRGGAWTALRMTELTALRQRATRTLLETVDAVVAVSGWVRDLLIANGVPAEKVTLSRQGLAQSVVGRVRPPKEAKNGAEVRAVLLGRLDPIKGVEVVLRALRAMPEVRLGLDVYAIPQGAGNLYEDRLRAEAAADPRVQIRPPVAAEKVVETIERYDVTLIPSQGLETGPLVVYESFAAGVPVVGSRLGGIAELVRDGVDGLLVEPADSTRAWAAALQRICSDSALLRRLRVGIAPQRTMQDVAGEMMKLYQRLAAHRESVAPTSGITADHG